MNSQIQTIFLNSKIGRLQNHIKTIHILLSFHFHLSDRFVCRHVQNICPESSICYGIVKDDALTRLAILEEGDHTVISEHHDPVTCGESEGEFSGPSISSPPAERNTGTVRKVDLVEHLATSITNIHFLVKSNICFRMVLKRFARTCSSRSALMLVMLDEGMFKEQRVDRGIFLMRSQEEV